MRADTPEHVTSAPEQLTGDRVAFLGRGRAGLQVVLAHTAALKGPGRRVLGEAPPRLVGFDDHSDLIEHYYLVVNRGEHRRVQHLDLAALRLGTTERGEVED